MQAYALRGDQVCIYSTYVNNWIGNRSLLGSGRITWTRIFD